MNYMAKVAEMLGVELGERFKIEDGGKLIKDIETGKPYKYFIDSRGLICSQTNNVCRDLFVWLLGDEDVKPIKLPWKPKDGETYYRVLFIFGKYSVTHFVFNSQDTIDVESYAFGNCFRTGAEAEAHKDEILQKMKEVLEG